MSRSAAGAGRGTRAALDKATQRIYFLAGEPFNIGSPKQLQQILFEKLALPPTKKTKTGFSTDESVLEELALSHELPREILAHRQLAKLKSTYVYALPTFVHPETGRIHCSFDRAVAATGRLSSSRPNLQNIPIRTALGQEIRAAFVPAEGRVLLSADYSQIELRILAHLSQDAELVKAFQEGADIHVRTASRVRRAGVGGDSSSAAHQGDQLRDHLRSVGLWPGPHARDRAGRGTRSDRRLLRALSGGPQLHSQRDSERAERYARTMADRRRYLPDLRSPNRVMKQAAERMAVNSVIQGTAADVIKRAMIQLDRDLATVAPSARMILTVQTSWSSKWRPAIWKRCAAAYPAHAGRHRTLRSLVVHAAVVELARCPLTNPARNRGSGRIRRPARWSNT